MRKIGLLVIALFSLGANGQEFTVFYKEVRKANYHSLRSSEWEAEHNGGKEISDLIKDKAKTHEKELLMYEYTSILRVDSYKSIHYPLNEIVNDTINNSIEYGENGHTFISREVSQKSYTVTYMDLDSRTKVSTDRYSGKDYLISEKLEELDWKITNEKKTIGRYTCRKAIFVHLHDDSDLYANDHEHIDIIEVWFTEDIKSSHGPLGYWGLPGLILEIKAGSNYILFDKIVYDLGDFKIKPPMQGKKISREGFKNLPILEFMEN
ncbi:GLPGLI family protein [Aquimarina gracilis]|uniref:GLPGLI family protein n=1 Tax=Aquimarina gracilis TaxID=874422 RepID=A0ABU5ZWK3_9FLAO|nr:GLPGLI family protein [Aquimarina gracilis]MEB3346233.1 GLPGLI family protein [Aquimarina gracilis]